MKDNLFEDRKSKAPKRANEKHLDPKTNNTKSILSCYERLKVSVRLIITLMIQIEKILRTKKITTNQSN